MLNLVLPNVHNVKVRLTYELVETIHGKEVLPVARITLPVVGLEPSAVRDLMHHTLAGHGVDVTLRSPQERMNLGEVLSGMRETVEEDTPPGQPQGLPTESWTAYDLETGEMKPKEGSH